MVGVHVHTPTRSSLQCAFSIQRSTTRRTLALQQSWRVPCATAAASVSPASAQPIKVSDNALTHLQKLRAESGGNNLLLRMGVKTGGCNGLSYDMKFEEEANIGPDDTVMEFDDGFKLVCNPQSLLYLFGMELDYSDALVGGGFKFINPSAESSCGCGKSFSV